MAIEAHLDRGRGPVATVLVQRGTLRPGDSIVAGDAFGRVRAMLDEHGDPVDEATPARPVQVLGLTSVPGAGDSFLVVAEDRVARQIAQTRQARERNAQLAKRRGRRTLEDFLKQLETGEVQELNLILKGDVSGSVEALEDSLMEHRRRRGGHLRVIDRGVGAITETNVMLAAASKAVIIGFNVRPQGKATEVADREGVDIRYYNVIYAAIDDIEAALKGMLKPEYEEVQLGTAEVREVFKAPASSAPSPGRWCAPGRSGATARRGWSATASSWPTTCRSARCGGSRTTSPRSATASSAASAWGRSTTSRSTTSSRRSSCARRRATEPGERRTGWSTDGAAAPVRGPSAVAG